MEDARYSQGTEKLEEKKIAIIERTARFPSLPERINFQRSPASRDLL